PSSSHRSSRVALGANHRPPTTKADASTQARLNADPSAAARAAVAVTAIAQGVSPPILPRELELLDRVWWVLGMVHPGKIASRVHHELFSTAPGVTALPAAGSRHHEDT
ncbi:unnamed protein product, partial [Discosporangium mesarthrocarpum]